jgi:hypothetical protein
MADPPPFFKRRGAGYATASSRRQAPVEIAATLGADTRRAGLRLGSAAEHAKYGKTGDAPGRKTHPVFDQSAASEADAHDRRRRLRSPRSPSPASAPAASAAPLGEDAGAT